jgi:ABC-2 type transport system ATP-binding protein
MIQILNLDFRYNAKTILDDINLNLPTGYCYGLLGANGSGKSTLLNCVANVLQPYSGQIIINGMPYKDSEVAIKKLTGFVLDANPLIEDFTGWQYMNFVGILYGLKGEELKRRIVSIVNFFFADPDVLVKNIHTFSTGMKKKLSVCAAIIHQPRYLVLDEPFAGLDIMAAKKLIDFIKFYLNKERLIFISSHDLHFINQIVSDIIVIQDAKIIFNDSLNAFVNNGDQQIDRALYNCLVPEEIDYDWKSIQWLK